MAVSKGTNASCSVADLQQKLWLISRISVVFGLVEFSCNSSFKKRTNNYREAIMAVASGTARYITSGEFGLVSCRGLSISFFHSALKVKHTL